MEAKHTPGPWVWAMDRQNQYTTLRQSGVGDVVADPQADISNYGLSVAPWINVSEADAALIASAPALLEALKLYDHWRSLPQDRGGKNGPKGRALDAFIAAKDAAISQAEGGE